MANAKIENLVLIGWYMEDARVITQSSVIPGLDIESVILGE